MSNGVDNGFLSVKRIERGPWQSLERSVARLFEHAGWPHVAMVGGSGDHGADIIVSDDNTEFLVQVKFRNKTTSTVQKAGIEDVKKAMDYYSINQGYIVTNTSLSHQASKYLYSLNEAGYKIGKIEGRDLLDNYHDLPSLPTKEYTPHPYQIQVIDSILKNYFNGTKRTMISLATGLGKTFVAGTFIKRVLHDKPDSRILVLADQKALVEQFDRALWKHLPKEISTHIWHGDEEPSYESGITLATFQKMSNVMNKGEDIGNFEVVIVDEAHHAPSPSYSNLIEKLDKKFLLGMTATPWRTDKNSLEDLFGTPCNRCVIDIVEALRNGYLSKVDYRLLCDNMDWELVHSKSSKNYTIKDLNKKLFLESRDEEILKEIMKFWQTRKPKRAIIYCASIEHAKRMESLLRERDFSARCLHSSLDRRDTEERLRKFRQGKIQILTSMNMLNEGVDVPEVDLIVFLRVTHSRIIFLQQLGRGLRLSEGKEKVVVLDFVADIKRIAAAIEIDSELSKGADKEVIKNNFGVHFSSENAQSFFEEYLLDQAQIIESSKEEDIILFP